MIENLKKRLSGIVAGFALLVLAPMAFSQAQNPSFENGTGFSSDNWFQFSNTYREAVGARNGVYALKMFGPFSGSVNASGAYQDFAVTPGQSASASVWGQTLSSDQMQGNNFALLKIIYRDASNNDLVASESARIDSTTTPDQYQQLFASLGPAPAGTDHGSVFLLFIHIDFNLGGSAFFDDVELTVTGGTQTLTPTSTNVLLGAVASGNNASLAADDANFLKICKAFVPSLSSPKIRFESDFNNAVANPTQITANMKARMSTGGVFLTRVYLADRTGGGYVYTAAEKVIADSAINTTYATYTGNAAGVLARYTNSGTMRTRVEIQQTGFSAAAIPCSEFEQLNLVVTP